MTVFAAQPRFFRYRSARVAAARPGSPVTPPPGCIPEPPSTRPSSGVLPVAEPDGGPQRPGSQQSHVDVGHAPVAYPQPRTEVLRRLDERGRSRLLRAGRCTSRPWRGCCRRPRRAARPDPSRGCTGGGQRVDVERLLPFRVPGSGSTPDGDTTHTFGSSGSSSPGCAGKLQAQATRRQRVGDLARRPLRGRAA